MNLTVNTKEIVRKWPRVEVWQNSTLRYSPPKDFPRHLVSRVGRAKIMRTWITLDEYWDYKTDTFFPDYQIGVNRYPVEEMYYPYDWKNIRPAPSGIKFIDYLTSHAAEADELLLNIRRLEREALDGVITLEKYEEIFEKAVEYCKELAPNIRYIECCNEVDGKSFGGITSAEDYYKLYKCGYRAIRRLNKKHSYEMPLEYGGYSRTPLLTNFPRWEAFLETMANDKDEERMIDFYSIHLYNETQTISAKRHPEWLPIENMSTYDRFRTFSALHNKKLAELGLPRKPVFINEIGFTRTSGVLTDSQKNASGIISMLIGSADLEDLYLFPWCSFHNPELQISFTQFLLLEDGSYASTPNGNAITMLHRLLEDQVKSVGDDNHCSVATTDGERLAVICTNPTENTDEFRVTLENLEADSITVKEYLVDSYRNNRVTGEKVSDLHTTKVYSLPVSNGKATIRATAEPYAFVLWDITPEKAPEQSK